MSVQSTTGTALLDLLDDGARGTGTIRFVPSDPDPIAMGDVWRLAGRAGADLIQHVGEGGVVGVVLESTPAAVATLLGAWRAGLTVVSLPHPGRSTPGDAYAAQLRRMCDLTDVSLVVADHGGGAAQVLGRSVRTPLEVTNGSTLSIDSGPASGRFVQFTSGSTSAPKGVELSLDAIAANVLSILDTVEPDRGYLFCSWLPLSHDMGLIGQLLTSWVGAGSQFTGGSHLCLIAPQAFQTNPSIWLRTCSDVGATHTAAPNFAYEIAARFLARTQSVGLSSLQWCACGAEPVRPATLRSFAAAAAPFGFRAQALSPCYGMAEASLAATIVRPSESWTSALVDRAALARRRWVEGTDDVDEVVAVGRAVRDVEIRVAAAPGEDVGQIEMRGPSMLTRYIGAPSPYTDDGWVRTSDEGVIAPDGQLYVLGRADDVIVLRGRNLYMTEIETIAGANRLVRPGNCAVVADGAGRYLVVAERRLKLATDEDLRDAARVMRRDLVEHVDVGPSAVLFTPAGSLPRTPSGKLQRHRIVELRRMRTLPVDLEVAFGGD